MRLRNIKGAREAIEASPYVILDPENYKGRWHEVFGNDHLLRLEVGMGKGQFIMEQARRHSSSCTAPTAVGRFFYFFLKPRPVDPVSDVNTAEPIFTQT